ncbi:MAG TPA: DCC1-like thiol-disulfide oxidoreductase family protein [Candidatus Bathyarchaeia archaeon]|nr:DCC1-like thiol-disulfide oxidoreductase family protein [Candidatus Bathyarchaeia archaeon]
MIVTVVAAMADHVLLYDADCGMCTRFRNTIDFLDVHRKIDFMPIDRAEQIGRLDSLPDALRHRSFHLILPDKHVESGAEALPTLVSLLPYGRLVSKIITSSPLGQQMLSFLYSVVARRHEAGLCKLQTVSTGITDELDNLGTRATTKIRRFP